MVASVVIVGAGSVGVNAALILHALGIEPVLIDTAPDILHGAAEASFINHGDGFEYYKRGHRTTGENCIDGALTKALLHPRRMLATDVCTPARPIRFLVAEESVGVGELTVERFVGNAGHMQEHFARQFAAICAAYSWSEEEGERVFLRRPDTFYRRLEAPEYTDVAGVAAACAGSSFGINMPHYYALLKAALRASAIPFHGRCAPTAIEKTGNIYRVHAGGRTFDADHVLLTAAHQIPMLTGAIHGSPVVPPPAGTYFLNAMTFLRLPATDDPVRLDHASRINFTLQQEHGAMFACIVPPSPTEDGLAATYYPSSRGSQLRQHVFDPAAAAPPPAEWDRLIAEGLNNDDQNVQRTFAQARRLYPFLDGYAELSHTICRTVFNAATSESRHGTDRRVREISGGRAVTADGKITAWTAPKWTNAELVALMAADEAIRSLGMPPLPREGATAVGPQRLDIAAISQQFHFRDTSMSAVDALAYARRQRIPPRVVNVSMAG